jgi:hypothetical protein
MDEVLRDLASSAFFGELIEHHHERVKGFSTKAASEILSMTRTRTNGWSPARCSGRPDGP